VFGKRTPGSLLIAMCSLPVAVAHGPVHFAATAGLDQWFQDYVLRVGLGGRSVLNADDVVYVSVPEPWGDEIEDVQEPAHRTLLNTAKHRMACDVLLEYPGDVFLGFFVHDDRHQWIPTVCYVDGANNEDHHTIEQELVGAIHCQNDMAHGRDAGKKHLCIGASTVGSELEMCVGVGARKCVCVLECACIGVSSYWSVLVLECARIGVCSYWSVLVLECARIGVCSYWS
jgi:hypothetical protein